jgi:hypothetical protein
VSPAALLAELLGGVAPAGAAGGSGGLSPETARTILWAIAGAGALAWLLALRGWLRIRAESPAGGPAGLEGFDSVRAVVLQGAPGDLAEGLARALASPGWGLAALAVKRPAPDCLEAAPLGGASLRRVPSFDRCTIELRSAGAGGTEAVFRSDFAALRGRALRISGALLAAGLAWLVALTLLLHFLAAGAEQPAVRYQVVQAAHAVHLLWPPWLIYALYRRSRRASEMVLDAAAANAAALAEAFAAGRARASRGG